MKRGTGMLVVALLASGCGREAADGAHAASHEPKFGATPPAVTGHARRGVRTGLAAARDPAEAQAWQVWQAQDHEALRAYAEQLAGRQDARSQMLLALLLPMLATPRDETTEEHWRAQKQARAEALAEAARRDPDDALIAWLQAMQCAASEPACQQVRARLTQLDPDNAATWTLALGDALRRGDEAAIDRFLKLAAGSDGYRWAGLEARHALAGALLEVPLPPRNPQADRALAELLGHRTPQTAEDYRQVQALALVFEFPESDAVRKACVPALPSTSGRWSDCVATLALMADSDTTLISMIGLTRLVELTAGHASGAHWREQLRQLAWLLEVGQPLSNSAPGFGRQMLELGELGALRALLARHGRPRPPTGWLPRNPGYRRLIIDGRR